MGELWVAHDTGLDRQVAVKLIHDGLSADSAMRLRFQREAQAAARLKSPHVVPIFDHGEDAGTAYIVMELLEGEGLDRRLREEIRFSRGEAVWLCQEVARGLTVAHEAGVVHRDLKPSNLFITEVAGEALVKILDFGIARLDGFEGATTMTGELVGSPRYMSPEQATGVEELDHRSDLFSLGTILYNALTGTHAFDAASLALVLDRVRAVDLAAPCAVDPDLPSALDAFFERAMARNPRDRFQSASDMATAFTLAVHADPVPLHIADAEPGSDPTDEPETLLVPPEPSTEVMAAPTSQTHRGVSRPVIDPLPLEPAPWWSRSPHAGRTGRLVLATVVTTALLMGTVAWGAFGLGEPAGARPEAPAASPQLQEPREALPVVSEPPEASAAVAEPPAELPASAPRTAAIPSVTASASALPAETATPSLPAPPARGARPQPPPSPQKSAPGEPKRLKLGY